MSRELPADFWTMARGVAPSLPNPIFEHRFHPTRKWRLDLAWPHELGGGVAVECHGGTWAGGRHVTGEGFEKDREKMNWAQLFGWTVLEFTASQIDKNIEECVRMLENALRRKGM